MYSVAVERDYKRRSRPMTGPVRKIRHGSFEKHAITRKLIGTGLVSRHVALFCFLFAGRTRLLAVYGRPLVFGKVTSLVILSMFYARLPSVAAFGKAQYR